MRHAAPLLAALTLMGCIVDNGRNSTDPDDFTIPTTIPENIPPEVLRAEAGVFYDAGNADDIWYFEATVDDEDGVYDVVQVFADVYEGEATDPIESFQLFETEDPFVWFSDWLGSTTLLDAENTTYTVDIVAYDTEFAEHAVRAELLYLD